MKTKSIFQIKITCSRDESVWRLMEFTEDATLHDVHNSIQDIFELDDDHLYAFFLSGKRWDRKTQYAGPRGRSTYERKAEKTSLQSLRLVPGRTFVYIFDFGDELWYDLAVTAVLPADAAQDYPRLAASEGVAPPQYPPWEDEIHEHDEPIELGALQPLADDLEDVLTLMEPGEDGGIGTPYDRALLLRALAIAKSLFEVLVANEDDFYDIDEATWHDVPAWLSVLPFRLASGGLVDEAVALGRIYASRPGAWNFSCNTALILAEAGRADEARAELGAVLAANPQEIEALVAAGHVHWSLNELPAAESFFRQGLALAGDHILVRRKAAEPLAQLLRNLGREKESKEVLIEHKRIADGFYRNLMRDVDDMPVIAPVKVGRNEPCPCGSGKKFKKCCLSVEVED